MLDFWVLDLPSARLLDWCRAFRKVVRRHRRRAAGVVGAPGPSRQLAGAHDLASIGVKTKLDVGVC